MKYGDKKFLAIVADVCAYREMGKRPDAWAEADLRFVYDQKCDEMDAGNEAYGEIYAQYRSEIGQFGDAWPGAAIQIHDMNVSMNRCRALLDTMVELWPWLDPTPPPLTLAERAARDNALGIEEPF